MNTFCARIYRFCFIGMKVLGTLFISLFFLSNFFITAYCLDMNSQKVLFSSKSLVLNLLLLPISAVIVFFFLLLVRKKPRAMSRVMQFFTPFYFFLWGILMLLFSRTVPAADALSVYNCAKQISAGNLSSIMPSGSYLSYYPQQIGLVAFFEILFRFFRPLPISLEYYHLLKPIYSLMTIGIIYYLLKITALMFGERFSEKIRCVFLLLCCLNAPLIMYSSFLYSEVPSFLSLTFGLYHLIRVLHSKEDFFPHSLYALLGMILAVLIRKNSLIFIIAAVITLLCTCLQQCSENKKHALRLLLLSVVTVLCSLSILPCLIKFYEWRAGNSLKSGVTAMSYFAMGMQESPRAAGWYNGFNFNTYDSTGMDSALANEISKAAISERIRYFQANPLECFRFYAEKYLSQWTDGTYACRQATLATYGGRNQFFQDLYDGKYSRLFIVYCNTYQVLIAFGCVLYLIAGFAKFQDDKIQMTEQRQCFYMDLLLLGAFGGFLFHMLWEANSRYIFPYGLCFLPYCAIGFVSAFSMLPCAKRIAKADNSGNK